MAITRRRDDHSALLTLYVTNLQPVFLDIKFATASATRCGVGPAPVVCACADITSSTAGAYSGATTKILDGEWHGVGWALVAPSLLSGAPESRVDGLIGDAGRSLYNHAG
jgi:hypothetical protein